jgi:sodium transport system ATP-binding protein
MHALEIEALTRDFGDFRAVDNVTFHVSAGEVVGLLGANGAGKTTALRMLAGLLTPTFGHARINGLDVQTQALEARRHLGFLTSLTGLPERLTGREVLRTYAKLFGVPDAQIEANVTRLIDELDLHPFIDVRTGKLSSGQKQRISIARAVVHDPLCYVLDEPTAALDPVASLDIARLVEQAKTRNKAVLLSTHRMEEASEWCSRLVVIHAGKIQAQGTVAKVLEAAGQDTLTKAFLTLSGALPKGASAA